MAFKHLTSDGREINILNDNGPRKEQINLSNSESTSPVTRKKTVSAKDRHSKVNAGGKNSKSLSKDVAFRKAISSEDQSPLEVSRKRYVCHCSRSFTTSGHLARHTRIHTGEKNYMCPFDGCDARFSRQDNCMQHYRTHLAVKARQRRNTCRSQTLLSVRTTNLNIPTRIDTSPSPMSSHVTPSSASVANSPLMLTPPLTSSLTPVSPPPSFLHLPAQLPNIASTPPVPPPHAVFYCTKSQSRLCENEKTSPLANSTGVARSSTLHTSGAHTPPTPMDYTGSPQEHSDSLALFAGLALSVT